MDCFVATLLAMTDARAYPSCPGLTRPSTSFRSQPRAWMPGTSPGMTSREAAVPDALSKHLEIFAMLPVRHLGLKPLDLRVLDMNVIIHELRPQRLPEERIVLQRKHRLAQALRQQRSLGFVRCIGRWPRIELAIDTVQP